MNSAVELYVPPSDRAAYACLPDAVRADAARKMEILRRIMAAPNPLAEAAVQARLAGSRRGYSRASLIRYYYSMRKAGASWRCLVDHARMPRTAVTLPAEFIEHWKSRCERNQRASRPAWRALITDWRAGIEIPGYPRQTGPAAGLLPPASSPWPPAEIAGLPRGWTYRNLLRYAPTPFERIVARRGRSAAAEARPLVHTTRVGLSPGQVLFFDDLEHDLKVNFMGVNRQAMRPLELCCLDLFSGCKIAWGMKPTIEDDGIKQKLKEREMRFLLAYILTRIGYRPEGTILGVEHGTAAIREDLAALLSDHSDGAIVVQRSGIEGAAALVYEGRGKGIFRFKAPLESSHNLAHNETAALPGQMGLSRDAAPEELHGRERHNNALVKAASFLPPERADLLRLPFLEFGAFMRLYGEIVGRINHRDWHELEGWLEAGLVAHEFRLAQDLPWMPAERLLQAPEQERRAIQALISAPGLTRVRKMSPAEVWARGQANLVRLPGYLVPQIIGPNLGIERKVDRAGVFEFQDRELGPGTFRYLARAKTPDGAELDLAPGESFLTFCNPFDPGLLYVCKAGAGRGAYLGACRRWEAPCRADVEAVRRQMGAAAHEEARLLAPFQARHTQELRQRAADARWNRDVLAGKPLTEAERAARERIRSAQGNADALFERPADPVEEPADQSAALAALDKMFGE